MKGGRKDKSLDVAQVWTQDLSHSNHRIQINSKLFRNNLKFKRWRVTWFPAHQGKLFYFFPVRENSGNLRKMSQIREFWLRGWVNQTDYLIACQIVFYTANSSLQQHTRHEKLEMTYIMEFWNFIREKSGKNQGIVFSWNPGNPEERTMK